jgi:hypothetical protein
MEEEEETALDSSWIEEFEKNDKYYEKYYLDDLYCLKINSLYIDASSNIMNVKEERFFLSKMNVLQKAELVGLLKKNTQWQNKKYRIKQILQYNITLPPESVASFMKRPATLSAPFLKSVPHIEDIVFYPSISMFQDLNDLYFLFETCDGTGEKKNATKRIVLRPQGRRRTRREK